MEDEENQHFWNSASGKQPDIFGGDSDLSDVEDEEPAAQSPAAAPREEEEEEEEDHEDVFQDDDDDNHRDEEYRAEGGSGSKSLSGLKIKKKPREERDDDGEDEGRARKKKKTKKTREREPAAVIEEEDDIDPEVARRRQLEARLDAIIKKPKNRGGKKRGGDQDDDLEAMNDEAVVRLRNEMYTAADLDVEENETGRFAIHKLRMLPRVVDMMQRATLAESLVENGLLDAVKRWLEPLPDKSLPAVNIQRPLFEILRNLSIETSALKSSGLGKIVYFYTKCKRVEPFIRRIADQLVADWMRPIIRRSKAFTDKVLDEDEEEEDRIVRRKMLLMGVGMQKKALPEEKGTARRHARIPEGLTAAFKLAPEDLRDRGTGSMNPSHAGTGVTLKMRSFKKKLIQGQQAQRRV